MKESVRRPLVVTHNGKFHPDDVFAAATLHLLLGNECDLIRTRDPEIIAKGDYVFDVGHIYDPEKNRFDHHQEGGAGGRENGIPYSSFGLVWKKYGETVCGFKDIAEKLDNTLVQAIDCNDVGILSFLPARDGVAPYPLEEAFDVINNTWHEEPHKDNDVNFLEAMRFAQFILERNILHAIARKDAEEFVKTAYENSDKKLVVLEKHMPWKKFLTEKPEPLFVVYPNPTGGWRVQGVPSDYESFDLRKKFPKEWGGKSPEETARITGVDDATFCHQSLWIAGADSKEGAILLAKKAIESKE